jgi:transposase
MRKLREILRQKWERGRSHREVAASLGLSVGIVSATLERAQRAGVDAQGLGALGDAELEARLYPSAASAGTRRLPDFAAVHTERQKRGVTLQLLHLEYLEEQPGGYRYTQFCEYYRRWCRKRRISMRQIHRAGEKAFVDYSGKRPVIYDARTGEPRAVELFVGVLGASSYTYAEASASQQMPEFLASHSRMLEFFGGATEVVVPDQLRSGVRDPDRYEPELQRPYAEWAAHYGTTVIPARPAKPRDKAKVEVGVQVAQRWILARLRRERLDSVAALNVRIRELLPELNDRPMRVYGQSRRERFEALDRPALRPLPALRWVYAQWKQARLNIDAHVEFERHLLRSASADRGPPRAARERARRGDLCQGRACGLARAQSRARWLHDRPRASAPLPPAAPGLVALAPATPRRRASRSARRTTARSAFVAFSSAGRRRPTTTRR